MLARVCVRAWALRWWQAPATSFMGRGAIARHSPTHPPATLPALQMHDAAMVQALLPSNAAVLQVLLPSRLRAHQRATPPLLLLSVVLLVLTPALGL